MKTIELTKGFQAIVDDEDYARVVAAGSWHWCAGYGRRTIGPRDARQVIYLHQFILGRPLSPTQHTSVVVDHKNQNRLDNRKANLRVVNRALNRQNASDKTFTVM